MMSSSGLFGGCNGLLSASTTESWHHMGHSSFDPSDSEASHHFASGPIFRVPNPNASSFDEPGPNVMLHQLQTLYDTHRSAGMLGSQRLTLSGPDFQSYEPPKQTRQVPQPQMHAQVESYDPFRPTMPRDRPIQSLPYPDHRPMQSAFLRSRAENLQQMKQFDVAHDQVAEVGILSTKLQAGRTPVALHSTPAAGGMTVTKPPPGLPHPTGLMSEPWTPGDWDDSSDCTLVPLSQSIFVDDVINETSGTVPQMQNSGNGYPLSNTPSMLQSPVQSQGSVKEKVKKDKSKRLVPNLDPSCVTSLMIRNIPCRMLQQDFVQLLDESGFTDKYDFLYLPVAAPLQRAPTSNLGYGFINFMEPQFAMEFREKFEGSRLGVSCSTKQCVVTTAHIQGLEAYLRHFRRTAVNNTNHKPYVRVSEKNEKMVEKLGWKGPNVHKVENSTTDATTAGVAMEDQKSVKKQHVKFSSGCESTASDDSGRSGSNGSHESTSESQNSSDTNNEKFKSKIEFLSVDDFFESD